MVELSDNPSIETIRDGFVDIVCDLEKIEDIYGMQFYESLNVDMDHGGEPDCGTPGCFAGWWGHMTNFVATTPHLSFFFDASQAIAKKCGFTDRGSMEVWLDGPGAELWGNPYGGRIFHDTYAFGLEEDKEDIINITSIASIADFLNGFIHRLNKHLTGG